ncbi:2Fe-2S iron-sulfur cluster-binding protein [Sphingomonas bacterium]|uniref:2Fe-2S iron-sulfur cluster-binding protein n=1 Tax=Sphingomonas bacterium TaxID=1895847 RepID=UPI00157632D1|nr:2Fe-2S iron-sulfur cluster-binding protein [Sphingomonas bacterium]
MTSENHVPLLRFHLPDGTIQEVLADGSVYTVMAAAKRADVPGIEGQCGGFRACATCHVHVAPAWRAIVGPPGADERDLLELTDDFRPESRLSCQIRISADLDGLELTPVP